jgi:hypothetical protein
MKDEAIEPFLPIGVVVLFHGLVSVDRGVLLHHELSVRVIDHPPVNPLL